MRGTGAPVSRERPPLPDLPRHVATLPAWAGKCVGISTIASQAYVVACEYGCFIVRFDASGSPPAWKLEQVSVCAQA